MPRMMNGILQILIIISQEQQIKYVMLNITTIVYKLRQEFKPSKKRKQTKKLNLFVS
jgi:hypothetical protein